MPADSWACRSLYATGVRLGRHRRSGSLALAILLLLILGIEEIEAQPGRRLQMRQGIPVEEDVKIGQATVEQIEADPKQFPVLPPDQRDRVGRYVGGISLGKRALRLQRRCRLLRQTSAGGGQQGTTPVAVQSP